MQQPKIRFHILAVFITVFFAFFISGCGIFNPTTRTDSNSGKGITGTQNQIAPGEVPATDSKGGVPDVAVGSPEKQPSPTTSSSLPAYQLDRKVVNTALISLETLKYDQTIDGINKRIIALGGYVEISNVSGSRKGQEGINRKAHFDVRIPSKSLGQFITDVGNLGNIISKENHGEDITGQYFDVDAHLKSLRIQEERLLTILQSAVKLQDIIELERELTQVRYEIENLTGTLKKWDNMVAYSKITIEVYEVQEITNLLTPPTTLWGRILRAFTDSVQAMGKFFMDVLVFIVAILPPLVVIGVIAGIVIIIVRSRKKRQKPKEETPVGK